MSLDALVDFQVLLEVTLLGKSDSTFRTNEWLVLRVTSKVGEVFAKGRNHPVAATSSKMAREDFELTLRARALDVVHCVLER